ncbi:MAG: cytochrome c oxidase subunit 3 family protein [Motiliproteus sp.]|nr:cytochrome c oxidase subunit 3 family protein [Motiliproteus sp.]MCW9051319.1 cytochrome c oxidase subunit 3 family protein [Motiliproteus sp.]
MSQQLLSSSTSDGNSIDIAAQDDEVTEAAPINTESNTIAYAPKGRLPGDLAMWFFILAELTAFALLFSIYAVVRAKNPEMFAEGQAGLDIRAGLANTLALLSSSFFVACAVASVEAGRKGRACIELIAAISMGAFYVVVKLTEYSHSISLGYDITTNAFYQFYYLLTAFHFLHVVLGMLILIYITLRVHKGAYSDGNIQGMESGACYWHMVDLLWLVLFPLVYVLH